MITDAELVRLWQQRARERGPLLAQMARLEQAYSGSVVIPIPELERSGRATVANLIQQGLDQTAMRIASTSPMVACEPANATAKRSKDRADLRRRWLYGSWEDNRMALKLRRRARHLIGYATSPVVLRPDERSGRVVWQVRDPLTALPSEMVDPELMQPDDCVFAFHRRAGWVEKHYPQQYAMLGRPRDASRDTQLMVLEYHDADEMVLLVVGDYGPGNGGWGEGNLASFSVRAASPDKAHRVVLERAENRVGRAQVVVPGRVTLSKLMGQFDGILPMYAQQAHLEALQTIAVEKAIFPDAYLISRPNEVAKFIVGPFDGRTGQVNVVEGGTIEYVAQNPGVQTNNAIDRLERNQRVSAGVSAEWGGESPTNVRTGKRGDAIMSAQVDFGVQEHQEVLAASLQVENALALDIAKEHFGSRSLTFSVMWKNAKGAVTVVPDVDFESSQNSVVFPAGGQDANALIIGIGQRVGVGTMSKETAQELDPLIADPVQEQRRVMIEQVDTAILSSVSQLAQSGQMAPQDATLLKRRLLAGDSIEDALDAVQKAAQERQSMVAPVAPGAPEAQPGIAPAGLGAEQGTIPPPSQDNRDLARMLQDLRSPGRLTSAERGVG